MTKLLDSDTCIAIARGDSPLVASKFVTEIRQDEALVLSTLVVHELWFGVYASPRPDVHRAKLERFLSYRLEVEPFDSAAAHEAGRIRAELRRQGRTIGGMDILIAGHALSRGWTLVTANTREFSRVKGLQIENWAAPQSE